MEFDYQQTYQLMRKFRELGSHEVLIMDYLMQRDYAEIGLNELAEIIGKHQAPTSRAIRKLEQRGIVHVVRKKPGISRGNRMVACFIVDGWLHVLNGDWCSSKEVMPTGS